MEMEATATVSGSGRWSWINRYPREHIGSGSATISSSSGTTVSTTYTSSSSASRLSSLSLSMEAAMRFDLEVHGDEDVSIQPTDRFLCSVNLPRSPPPTPPQSPPRQMAKEMKERNMKQMVQEFCGAPSADCSASVLEKWLTELGVGWVLHLADDGASPGRMLHRTFDAQSWIRALTEIKRSIRLATSPFPVRDVVLMPNIWEDEPETESGEQPRGSRPDQFQIAQFFQQTTSKMLAFVDVAVSDVLVTHVVPELHVKLRTLLSIHASLSDVLLEFQVRLQFHSPPSVEAEKMESEMESLLSSMSDKARDAILRKLAGIWACLLDLESMEDWSGAQTPPQASPDIYKLTRSIMGHITFLLDNFLTVSSIVYEKAIFDKYEQAILGGEQLLYSIIMEMVNCLEKKLVNVSNSFPDQGIKFIFLLNNICYIQESIWYNKTTSITRKVFYLAGKIEDYKERYLEISWAPLLSCLFNPSHLSFLRKYSPLSRFESDFQKTYNTQKLWKVPNCKLRESLREAITEKVIPCYKKYIKDNKITNPKFSPHELEEMLQELFEG